MMTRYDTIMARARELYDTMPEVDWGSLGLETKRLAIMYALPTFDGKPDTTATDINNTTARIVAILLRLACRGG